MTHRFPIKEIAQQAGLGPATVDRVLNARAHVSPQTKARVRAAIEELETQERQLTARGRRLFVDVVVEAPQRFTREVRSACVTVLNDVPGAVLRPRYTFNERLTDEGQLLALLQRIKARGTQGLVLKARATPAVAACVNGFVAGGIPVVTLVTDLPNSDRTAYVGLDNTQAGWTAAYLLSQALDQRRATVLVSVSQDDFQGETERVSAFGQAMRSLLPKVRVIEVSGGSGLPGATRHRLTAAMPALSSIDAVYSVGGGNPAILAALNDAGSRVCCFIAHDLDRENIGLLTDRHLTYVLHHDLRTDVRNAFQTIVAHHKLAPPVGEHTQSEVQVITPYSIPVASRGQAS